MAPRKAAKSTVATPTRSSGRAAKAAASAAIASDTPKTRGRPAKAAAKAAPAAPASAPKKRGRPARAKVEEPEEAVVAAPTQQTKGRGRGRKAAEPVPEPVAEEAPIPKKRGRKAAEPAPEPVVEETANQKKRPGRPRKSHPAVAEAPATPRRRGRPSAAAADINRVAGPSRVTKRATAKKTTPPAVGIRSSPRKPRTRGPQQTQTKAAPAAPKRARKAAPKEAPKQKKRLGRPPKNAAPAERPIKGARVTKAAPKPRKKRGYTSIEVPDKFADAMIDYLQQLIDNDAPAVEPEEKAEIEVDVTMEDAEDAENGEPTPTDGSNTNVNRVDDLSSGDEEGSILIIEEVSEEVVGEGESEELDTAVQTAQFDIEEGDELEAEQDPVQTAREAASDTDVDEDLEEPHAITEQIREVDIELLDDTVADGTEDLDIHQEIREVTESVPLSRSTEEERNYNSLFTEDEGMVSQVDVLEADSSEDDDIPAPPVGPPTVPAFGSNPLGAMFIR